MSLRAPCPARPFVVVALCLGLLAETGCAPPAGPDLVLVTIEALRVDRLGAYVDESGSTPALDALARAGVVFERAVTPSPSTLASAATILSGVGPHRHGVRDDQRYRLRPEVSTVAERLVAAGYATAAFVGSLSLHGSFGLGQGFAVYDDAVAIPLDPESAAAARRSADQVTDLALAWLRARSRSPYFLWVHYADLSSPRRPAPGGASIDDAYSDAVAALDARIAVLIDGLAAADGGDRERLLVVAATQGEALGEHGESGHGWLAAETTLRVPLLAVGPGFPPGRRATTWVGIDQIAATLVRAAGLANGASPRSLQQALDSSSEQAEIAWFESFAPAARLGWRAISGVRSGRWKFVALPDPPALYDVEDDPGETRDRSADAPDRMAALAAAHAALGASPHPPAAETSADRDERIARVGHLPSAPLRFDAAPPDPRRSIAALAWVERAADLARAGRVADSVGALELLAQSAVARPLALRRLGAVLLLSDRPDDAVAAFARLEALTGSADAMVSLAAALLASGRADAALRTLERLAEQRPVLSSRALLMRGHALLATDRPAAALDDAARVLLRRPDDDAALALASSARASLEGDGAGLAQLRALLDASPSQGERVQIRLALAEVLVRAARDREAVAVLEADPDPGAEILSARAEIAARRGYSVRASQLYEQALARRPSARHFHRALASLYESQGRFGEAARLYDALLETHLGDAVLLVARGTARLRAGRSGDAELDYREALSLDPDLPEPHYDLALIALARGDEAVAEAGLLRAVALRPDFSAAHLELSRIYHRRGDARSAEHAALAVDASDPTTGLH